MNNHQQQTHQVKIPFGEFPRVKCTCGSEMMQLSNRLHWWIIPKMLQYKYGGKQTLCIQLYICASCGKNATSQQGLHHDDLLRLSCAKPNCTSKEFTAIQIAYGVPITYRSLLNNANRLNIEYMLCSECGTPAKEINTYPLPEGVKWEPKK